MDPRNLILITADAWRADFADAFEGTRLLRALDPWAHRTARFTRARANAPWTSPAIVSLLTGATPHQHRVAYAWSTPREDTRALAIILADAGFHTPSLSYLNRVENYYNLGWSPDASPTDGDPALLLRAIADTPEPFFLWFHYKWTHLPYQAAPPFREALGIDPEALPQRLLDSVWTGFVVPRDEHPLLPEDRPTLRRLYAAGVLELDDWLKRVVEAVEARGLSERTALVLTADHGDELLEHGHVGHASTSHHATLFEEVLRVPLFIVAPDIPGPVTVEARVQGVDLFPTLLHLAGQPAAPRSAGLDLVPACLGDASALDAPRRFAAQAARMGYRTPRHLEHHVTDALWDGRFKIIRQRWEQETLALYDLNADPDELHPIHDADALAPWQEALDALDAGQLP